MKRRLALILTLVLIMMVPMQALAASQEETEVMEEVVEAAPAAEAPAAEEPAPEPAAREEAAAAETSSAGETTAPAAEEEKKEEAGQASTEAPAQASTEAPAQASTEAPAAETGETDPALSAETEEVLTEEEALTEEALLEEEELLEEEALTEEDPEFAGYMAADKLKYDYAIKVPGASSLKVYSKATFGITTKAPASAYQVVWKMAPASGTGTFGTIGKKDGVFEGTKAGKIKVTAQIYESVTKLTKSFTKEVTIAGLGGWTKVGSNTRYYAKNAKNKDDYYKGWHEIEKNKWYYFNPKNGYGELNSVDLTKDVTVKGEVSGKKITLGKGRHYFDKSNGLAIIHSVTADKNGLYYCSGKKSYYLVNKKSVALTDWQGTSLGWQYFDPGTGLAYKGDKNGWWTCKKDTKISGTDPKTGKKVSYTVKKGKHHFNDKGVLAISCWQKAGSAKFYFDKDGFVKTGWVTVKNKTYYVDKTKGAYTGLKTISKKTYYFDSDGVRQSGWFKINNALYYFDSKGVMQKNKTVNGIKLDKNGKATGDSKKIAMVSKAQQFTSKSSYLIILDKRTHKVGIFKGKKNNWVLQQYVDCSIGITGPKTGKCITPSGYFRTVFTEYHRVYSLSATFYNTYVSGGFYFHSVLYSKYDSSPTNVVDGRFGLNISNGCVRLPMSACKFIYNNCKKDTTVISN